MTNPIQTYIKDAQERFDERFLNPNITYGYARGKGNDMNEIKSHLTAELQNLVEVVRSWADKEYEYADAQLRVKDLDEDLAEYLTGKRNLAKDLIDSLSPAEGEN